MTQRVYKFGSSDLTRFITIYRNHECLWDTKHVNYKNRDARNTALAEFAEEFGVDEFGPKEITHKIKNIRTQYHAERKKIKDSMSTASSTAEVYMTKLPWYHLMDSFLRTVCEHKETKSNMTDTPEPPQNIVLKCEDESTEQFTSSPLQVLEEDPLPVPIRKPKKPHAYIETASNTKEDYKKRSKLVKKGDELNSFGKYVASSLRTLSRKNSIHAQEEIQAVLSKYKLKELRESRTSTPTPESPCSSQSSEDTW